MRAIILILIQLNPHGPSQMHLLLFFLFRQSALVLHSFLHLASDSDRSGHFGDERAPENTCDLYYGKFYVDQITKTGNQRGSCSFYPIVHGVKY